MKAEKVNLSLSDRICVLIVDDVDYYITLAKSNLIMIAQGHADMVYPQERLEFAEKYFALKTFNIVGDAMQYWETKEGKQTDVAIIDFDFSKLGPNLPKIEYGESRGADLIKIISQEKTTSLFCYSLFLKH